jgi:hypothetical protein
VLEGATLDRVSVNRKCETALALIAEAVEIGNCKIFTASHFGAGSISEKAVSQPLSSMEDFSSEGQGAIMMQETKT